MRWAASIVLLLSLLGACSSAPDASVAPASDAPSAEASASPSATQTAVAFPTMKPSTTPPPAAAFEWGEPVALRGVEDWTVDRPKLVFAKGTFVALDQARIWVSTDATDWDAADSPVDGNEMIEISDVVAGDAGFVAVGTENIDADDDGSPEDGNAVVLISNDGRRWDRIDDPRFRHAGMKYVAISRQGVVVFGYSWGGGASIWTSADGRAWLKATNPTGLHVAQGVQFIAESDGRLTAFVRSGSPTDDLAGPIEVWQTEGRADWEKVGELPDPSGALVRHAAYGAGRWFALGGTTIADGDFASRVWTSSDGRNWDHAADTTSPDGAIVNAIAGWSGGVIAAGSTGSEPGETCGGSEPWVGRTWLSTGAGWQVLPPTKGAAIRAMVIANDRIVGLGLRLGTDPGDHDVAEPVRWSATLPVSPVQSAPTPSPTPPPTPAPSRDGCGG